jgi:hypothetical protein
MSNEINKMEAKRTIQGTNERNSWFFERKNKIDKSLAKLTKRKKSTKLVTLRQIPLKSTGSLENILKTCNSVNWKNWKK